jgi:hypothetical protein
MARPRPAVSGVAGLLRGRRAGTGARPISQTDGARAKRAASAALAEAFGRPKWERRAECRIRGLDPDLFFTDPGEEIPAAALSACWACQVRLQCLRLAMATEVSKSEGGLGRYGIFGGLTANQRTRLASGLPVAIKPPKERNRDRVRKRKAAAAVRAGRPAGTAGSSGRRSARSRAGSRATS